MRSVTRTLIIALIATSASLLTSRARAQHFAGGQSVGQETVATYPDAAISPGAAPTPIVQPNARAVSRVCKNLKTSPGLVHLGDSRVAGNQGVPLDPGDAASLDANDALFAYSDAGATVSCTEVVRP